LNALEARLSRARRAADALHERARAVAAASDVGDTAAMARSAVVYERAEPTTSSIVQSSSAVAAASALAGFAIAVAWAWLRAAMRPRVHGVWDLPSDQPALVEFGPAARRLREALLSDPRLRGAAHIAAARLSARFGGRGAVCVAGAAKDTGLGSVAFAIAAACAEQGLRTLLIDPFGAVSTQGAFADALHGRVTTLRAAVPSKTEGLSLLAGDPHECQDPRLFGDAFAELLEGSLQRFDRVFVVVPETAYRVESQRCASLCSTTFVVLRAGRVLRSDAILAIDALAAVGASCGGVVLHGCGNAAARMAPPPSARPMPTGTLPAATDRVATLQGRNTTEASA
jgi:Mrp family chromosome partitioning ATPase